MHFTCRCGHSGAGMIQKHCDCGQHTPVSRARCQWCGKKIRFGEPEPDLAYVIAPDPTHVGRPWSPEEEAEMASLARRGVPSREIAEVLGRTPNAISTRRSRTKVTA